jgi:hypothetical protein
MLLECDTFTKPSDMDVDAATNLGTVKGEWGANNGDFGISGVGYVSIREGTTSIPWRL